MKHTRSLSMSFGCARQVYIISFGCGPGPPSHGSPRLVPRTLVHPYISDTLVHGTSTVGVGSQCVGNSPGAPVSFKVCFADQCWVVCPASSRQPCFVLRARAVGRKRGNRCRPNPKAPFYLSAFGNGIKMPDTLSTAETTKLVNTVIPTYLDGSMLSIIADEGSLAYLAGALFRAGEFSGSPWDRRGCGQQDSLPLTPSMRSGGTLQRGLPHTLR